MLPRFVKLGKRVVVFGVGLLLAAGWPLFHRDVWAQTPARQVAGEAEAQQRIKVNSNLVILPVTVKDRYGNLVADMEERDFRVFDDGAEQSIDSFTAEAFPLSLVILVDDDLKSKDAANLVASLRSVIGAIGEGDDAILCHFDLDFFPGRNFTGDEDELLAQLKYVKEATAPSKLGSTPSTSGPSSHPTSPGEPSLSIPIGGGSRATKALDDAVYSAAQLFRGRETGRRKIILLISDGIDGAMFNKHGYEETVNLLLHENIALYGLAVGSDSFQKKFGRMRDYANGSGGDLYFAAKSDEMEKLYSQMTEQARHEYTLTYEPKGNNAKSAYHVVRVVTQQSGLQVKTRQGYYGTTMETPAK